ncbi:phenylalanine 4-monooxygenase [Belnapia sp. T6]|uniref:phenylalanine 4-monooxygenase n=1 Tax=Belnapia mucosa TaxID=2804532 RepID=A0ABS1UZB8_9PROT|nr:phenylalanine 4-monooxygenase [Belnapia mucosa]MBL6454799.1 phenylalanine 4-monooxygenase [Belnapia mucosa]
MDGLIEGLPAGLRGNYAAAAADFTLVQDMARYAPEDYATWRTLYQRQAALLPRHAAAAYREGLARLPFAEGVPDFAQCSTRLRAATGWTLVAVPGLIPDDAFFAHLAARRFPVTCWIRRPEELDYIVEPDIFHDAFGHVPLLTQPDFAEFLAAYGRMGETAARIGALKPLARLYWHMVEFGLIQEGGALRAYGAGILSSSVETVHATESPKPRRLRFDVRRVLRSEYFIDDLQPTYFAIDSYAELFAAMQDLPRLLAEARDAQSIAPGAAAPGDQPI